MKRTYEVRDRADKRAIREFLKREGQFLLPMLELVEQTEVAIDEVIQVMGRATIEAVLEMSAEGVAGVKQAGRSRAEDDTVWYGRQGGVVYLSDRKVRVERPRLRRRGAGEGGEVEVPAYAAMRRPGAVADRMLEVLMAGVSTRKYGRVIGEMADTVGVSKSAVSRETVEASERVLKELMERRLDAWDLLVIYLDGIQMGSHHVLAAVGVDSDGKKHVLGVREGASENAEVTSALLEDLVERGLDPGRRRLFVIDGSKALRKAIEKVFGQRHPIQRCRNHKLRNVLGHLPENDPDRLSNQRIGVARRGLRLKGGRGGSGGRSYLIWPGDEQAQALHQRYAPTDPQKPSASSGSSVTPVDTGLSPLKTLKTPVEVFSPDAPHERSVTEDPEHPEDLIEPSTGVWFTGDLFADSDGNATEPLETVEGEL